MSKAKPRIELRPRENGDFDELVADGASIHIETMNNRCVWLAVEIKGRRVALWINSNTKLQYSIEDEPA